MQNAIEEPGRFALHAAAVTAKPGAATLTAQGYERLRDDIVLGKLRPGQKLTLERLRVQYGLGMTPLREALHRLSASKLVTLEDRRGFRVAPVSPEHLAEVIELREAMETMLLENAFKHGDLQWEARIVAAYQGLLRAADHAFNPGPYTLEWESAHRDFHFSLLCAARLPLLREFHLSLWDHCSRYRNLAYAGKTMSAGVFEGHKHLMDAALARDSELACVLLRRHISLATSHIMEGLFAPKVSSVLTPHARPAWPTPPAASGRRSRRPAAAIGRGG